MRVSSLDREETQLWSQSATTVPNEPNGALRARFVARMRTRFRNVHALHASKARSKPSASALRRPVARPLHPSVELSRLTDPLLDPPRNTEDRRSTAPGAKRHGRRMGCEPVVKVRPRSWWEAVWMVRSCEASCVPQPRRRNGRECQKRIQKTKDLVEEGSLSP